MNESYKINKDGVIESLSRIVITADNVNRNYKHRILKPAKDKYGYYYVVFSINGVRKKHMIHRLVAEKYIPNPDNKPEINHKNGIKTDNRVENLEWCTSYENKCHGYLTGLYDNKGESHGRHKLSNTEVHEIRSKYIPKIYGLQKLANEYNVSVSVIHRIISQKGWKHLT